MEEQADERPDEDRPRHVPHRLFAQPRLSADDYAGLVTDGRISVASEASYLHHLVHVLMPVRVPL